MKKILFIAALAITGILSTSIYASAQVSYDSLCQSYKTYYSIAEALKDPLNVQKLDLSMQKLTVFPEEIMQFPNLVCLDLSFNRIPTLPPSFATLTKIEYLNLTGTRYMGKLPSVLANMQNLKVLDLRDHPEWPASTFEEAKKLLPTVTILK
jgi:Leucine-rich repeat (LRR) protein